jgi:hypothetical protein
MGHDHLEYTMNVFTQTFPAACLMFGLFCALLALGADHAERRDLNRRAVLRRLICQPDLRPRQYLESEVPWRHRSWFGLNGVESSTHDNERSTRRES